MYCVKCGYPTKPNYKFCPKCGAKQPNVAAQSLSTDGQRAPRGAQEAEGMSQATGDSKNFSAGGTLLTTSTGLSVSIRYKLNGVTETVKLVLPCIIGRTSEWPFLLMDEEVTQQHAKVYLENDAVMIEDLCSLNGTFVNGKKIKGPVELLSGDEVTIGMTKLLFIVRAED